MFNSDDRGAPLMLRTALLIIAIASVAVFAVFRSESGTGECATDCDTTRASQQLDEPQTAQTELAEVSSAVSSLFEKGTVAATGKREPDRIAELTSIGNFEDLLGPADTRTGRELVKAFGVHDLCAGMPRDTTSYSSWLERHAGEVGFNFELAEHLYRDCREVPVLFFDHRVKLIEPIALSGDALAQHLLGTSYPLGTHTRSIWLLRAAENGHAPAHLSLVEQLPETAGNDPGIDLEAIEWYLYRRAGELTEGLGATELAQIESSLNASRREFVEDQLSNGSIELMLRAALQVAFEGSEYMPD